MRISRKALEKTNEMISLDECRRILKNSEKSYTNEDIKEIREILYQFAQFQLDIENNKGREIEDL